MAEQEHNARLNEILIRMLRGLLQYTGECWPWSSEEQGGERQVIDRLVAEQREDVQEIVDLLNERDAQIDFGTYPTEYTDLHYVSLDYLLDTLIAEQEELVTDLKAAIASCGDDPEGQELLSSILPQTEAQLESLKKLAAERPAGSKA